MNEDVSKGTPLVIILTHEQMSNLERIAQEKKLSVGELVDELIQEGTVIHPDLLPEKNSKSLQPRDFYEIDKQRIFQATTPVYRQFLREAGYMDLESGNGLLVTKKILRIGQDVRDIIKGGIGIQGNDGDYLVNINQTDGRKRVEAMGYKLLTARLMYGLFIPYIKELAQQGDDEAQKTLTEMTDAKAEWLEDLILNKKKLKIGTKEKALTFPQEDGRFDRNDLNEFGYPTVVKQVGEFYYWCPRDNERAAIRGRDSGLGLGFDWGPSCAVVGLGVRPIKPF